MYKLFFDLFQTMNQEEKIDLLILLHFNCDQLILHKEEALLLLCSGENGLILF